MASYIPALENDNQKELFEQNHNSWILVLHNEYGILDWMFSHRKS